MTDIGPLRYQTGRYQPAESKAFATPPFASPPNPNQMRWDPFDVPDTEQDFVDGIFTICGNGSPNAQAGTALHLYRATVPMTDRPKAASTGPR